MEWKGRRQSDNVQDKRGSTTKKAVAGGGIGAVLIAAVMMLLNGGNLDLSQLINAAQQGATQTVNYKSPYTPEKETELVEFVGVILAETEDVWNDYFRQQGSNYVEPALEIFAGQTQSGCGAATYQSGPFYCSADQKVYLDLEFFYELDTKYAKGEFPRAYVIAHEIGHHVQNLTGTLEKVHSYYGTKQYNQMSVRLELHADFLAGVWANKSKSNLKLTDADIRDALNAASAIGDDKLQKQAQGYAVPDSFTHGTSEQRMRWFKKGYDTGDVSVGNALFTMDYSKL